MLVPRHQQQVLVTILKQQVVARNHQVEAKVMEFAMDAMQVEVIRGLLYLVEVELAVVLPVADLVVVQVGERDFMVVEVVVLLIAVHQVAVEVVVT